ncbi:MAG: STAS domain-containing protein [Chthoniobacterales bacterium]
MRLTESAEEGVDVLALEGEIDLHYAPVLRSLLQGKVKGRCPALVLDFARVSFIDSSGLAAIVEYFRDAAEHQGVLCLAGLDETLQTVFEIVRLDKVIPIFASAAEAKEALKEGRVRPPGPGLFDRSAA